MTTRKSSSSSLLEHDIEIVGDISFSGDLYLQGRINGNVTAPLDSDATLYLQEGSEVIGEIRVPTIIAAGKIAGDVFAARRLSIKSTAEVAGNIHYIEVLMEQGASINGVMTSLRNGSDQS